MRPAPQHVPVEAIERGDRSAHRHDRARAEIPPAAVGRPTRRDELGPHEALVGQHQLAGARLGQNAAIRRMPPDEVVGAGARVFLVGDQRHEESAAESGFARQRRGGAHDRRRAAFHVVAATAVQTPVLQHGIERSDRHARGPDRVEMRAEDERGAGLACDLSHGVGAGRRGLFQRGAHSMAGEPFTGEARDLAFASRLVGRDGGIDRWNPDQRRGELDDGLATEQVGRHELPSGSQ